MKAHLDQWNWDTACWGEGNVVTMKKMMKGVCEECMKLPKNEFPAHALPKLSAALHKPGVAMKLHSMIPANFQQYAAYPYGQLMHNMHNPYAAYRGKREVEAEEFKQQAAQFKEDWECKISNLTCVLKTMGVIDDEYKMNLEFIQENFWAMKDLSATDNCPVTRMFGPLGRFIKFLQCKKEATKMLCATAQASRLVSKFHPNPGFDASEYGVRDKYEKAMI